MASVTVSESISRMEPGDEGGATLANDTKIGEFCSSGIQVAINEGNRQGHSFFVVKMGKTGCTLPFQQVSSIYCTVVSILAFVETGKRNLQVCT